MKRLVSLIILVSFPVFLFGAGGGVKVVAEEVFSIGSLPVTNSMVTSWIISILLIVGVKLLVSKPQLVPTKGQLIVESVIDGLRSILEPIVGKKFFFLLFGF